MKNGKTQINTLKKTILFCLLIICATHIQAQIKASDIIPKPKLCIDKQGIFQIKSDLKIYAPTEFSDAALLLAEQLHLGGSALTENRNASIVFEKLGNTENPEAFKLNIEPNRINISASTIKGAQNAVFTLIQLRLLQPDMDRIPCAEIEDAPRFSYRGMHLDVSRNFFPVSFIKKYIDMIALYKYNTFHWHLTDGPGWRLEIEKYPELTSKAAFRTHKTWKEWWNSSRKYSEEGNPNAYGGYYTQEDAREIVAYAARRGITVIPEIEMPGHSEEVLAVYPGLSCSGEPYKSGEFCIGNPETFTFLENVLSEVMEIFPSTYIHIGGDEASTKHWAECEKCQNLKKEQGLQTEYELQSYLIKHMEKFLKSHGRKLLGWDEIMEGGLPADATVMSWRGMAAGIKAAQMGHNVIMTPGQTYFDAYQSNPSTQPEAIGGYLPLNRVYEFEPVPENLTLQEAQHILGTQANLWSEYMPTTYQVEYMAYPRALALAEVAWTQQEKRDFNDFHRRLQSHYRLMQRMNINYYRPSSFLNVVTQPDYTKEQHLVSFLSEQYQPEIRFTTDGSNPVQNSEMYKEPFYTAGKTEVKAAIFRDGEQYGEISNYIADYHKAVGKPVIFNTRWSDSYPAQKEQTLTNGIKGSITYSDQQWLGYLNDFDVTVDMETSQSISSVSIRFMHQPGPGVHLPSFVELQFSDDGKTFTTCKKRTHDISPKNPELLFKTFTFEGETNKSRYIRIIAPNVMKGFMFIDEIVVY
jgi:hexosaminidase